jgi:hypothetical protein
MQKIENISVFLNGYSRLGLKGTLFNSLDIMEERNMILVVACLEQLMKKNQVIWTKAAKTGKTIEPDEKKKRQKFDSNSLCSSYRSRTWRGKSAI